MDVNNAFLHGDLTPGVVAPPGYVCLLRHALYGLKQAPHAWHECFVSMIRAAGFSPSDHDPALFVHLPLHGRTFCPLRVPLHNSLVQVLMLRMTLLNENITIK
jgi:hypothetical protein